MKYDGKIAGYSCRDPLNKPLLFWIPDNPAEHEPSLVDDSLQGIYKEIRIREQAGL